MALMNIIVDEFWLVSDWYSIPCHCWEDLDKAVHYYS